jgi:hypothetical protein
MTDADHEKLCELICSSPAQIVLSGYVNDLYERRLENWYKTIAPVRDEKGRTRTECIWTNFAPSGQNLLDFERAATLSA